MDTRTPDASDDGADRPVVPQRRGQVARSLRKLAEWIESAERQAEAQPGPQPAGMLLHLPAFYQRLTEEVERAERYERELSVAVFQMPAATLASTLHELEEALRQSIRRTDIPARLSGIMLAVLFPETGPGLLPPIIRRITERLTAVAGERVTSGQASFPTDSKKVSQLLNRAIQQSSQTQDASGTTP